MTTHKQNEIEPEDSLFSEEDAALIDAAGDFIRDFGPPMPDGSPADSAADINRLRAIATKMRQLQT